MPAHEVDNKDCDSANPFNVADLVRQLDLDEKIALTAGLDFWHTKPIPRLNIPSIRLSDGPNGVRGTRFFDSVPASCLPCGTALGATFDADLLLRVGHLLGDESKAKGVHVLLGPTINIQRGPLGGRGFESYSEDPFLSGILAGKYIQGVQEKGIAATLKHFVCNDMESERMAVNVMVTDRALREVYLLPFMMAIEMANPKAIMTAYSRVNGVHMAENKHILQDILRDEWKWDGLVMSDWYGTYSTSSAINAGLDLEMPGPTRWRGQALEHAVTANKVKKAHLDERVTKVLEFVKNAMADSGVPESAPEEGLDRPEDRELLREVSANSIVLLKNNSSILPFDPSKTVAVIGPNANIATYCGGGSASLRPYRTVTPLEGIRAQAEGSVRFSQGAYGHQLLPQLGPRLLTPGEQQPGYKLRVYNEHWSDSKREPLEERVLDDANALFIDYARPDLGSIWYAEAEGILKVDEDEAGVWDFGLSVQGTAELFIDGQLIVSNVENQRPGPTFMGCGTMEELGSFKLEAGREYRVLLQWGCSRTSTLKLPGLIDFGNGGYRFSGCKRLDVAAAIRDAVEVARQVDQVVLCVGTSGEWESEGFDRPSMDLPPNSDELISAVLEANPNTCVVVQSGTPVTMPWESTASAILQAWFGGNESGHAIADVVFGAVNPSAKLPLTMPRRVEDNPSAVNFRSEAGRVLYGEDVYVGYKWFDRLQIEPLFAFGHGLSYTTFSLSKLEVSSDADNYTARVTVRNTGSRVGAEVIQVYVSAPPATLQSAVCHPPKQLKGFMKVSVQPGEEAVAEVQFDRLRATSYWDESADCWRSEAGVYKFLVGSSSRGDFLSADVEVAKTETWTGLRT